MNARIAKLIGVVMVATMMVTACAPSAATVAPTVAPTEAMSQIDCMGASSGDAITIVYQWSGSEEENFNTILKPLVDACGIKVTAQSTRDDAVLDTMVKSTPPDVLFWPNFSPLKLYADKLLPIASVGAQVGRAAARRRRR